jgi:2-polyprenyl-3-methyl-5-hydroxy-6-metoxy-1,4-benzoquinol methylase
VTQHTDSAAADDWDSHWGAYASSAEDNPAQRFRRALTFERLERAGTPRRLLDIGAGQGDLLLEARRRWPDASLAGVELSEAGVAATQTKVHDATVFQANLLEGAADHRSLDGWATHAVCSEVLEHVDDPVMLLKNARPLLSKGCLLVVTVPGGPRSAFDRHIGHRRHHDRHSISQVLSAAGFVEIDAQATGFPIFNVYKLMVIARGRRVIDDAHGEPSPMARRVMAAFDRAFRIAPHRGRLGWQIVATARAS